jgi:hypothetical protein
MDFDINHYENPSLSKVSMAWKRIVNWAGPVFPLESVV